MKLVFVAEKFDPWITKKRVINISEFLSGEINAFLDAVERVYR